MAIIPMQKVAIMSLKSLKEDVLHVLHDEGVLEVSDAREGTGGIDHAEVAFRKAELEFAISALLPLASKKLRAAMNKKPTKEEVVVAALHTDIRSVIDQVHALDKKEHEARKHLHEHKKGAEETAMGSGLNEAAYFTGSVPHADAKNAGAQAPAAPNSETLQEIRRLEKSLDDVHEARLRLAEELPSLARALIYLRWLDDKQAVREAMRETKSTVTLFGWVAKRNMARLEKKLHDLSDATAILKVKPDENETMPVQLKNPKFLTPFESVTKLYGLPQATEMDPTPYLALFFILFFALCLTDAGYGLVQAILMGGYLLHSRKKIEEAPLIWLLFFSGIVTILVSIPFGGWFGMTPQQAPSFMTETRDGVMWFKGQVWNLSDTQGITFLQNLSLALGVIHLSFGVMLAAYWKALQGKIAAAFWQDVSTLSMIGALIALGFAPADYTQYALYAVYGSVAFMIWGKGYGSPMLTRPLFGFLQTLNWFLGMLGNVLSYLRILALGLVTGALAFTVNLVAEQIGAMLPWFVAIPFMIAVYVVGHTMNIALNVLGAFIHSGRLQFVEFFSQFFEGGGRPFKPFARAA